MELTFSGELWFWRGPSPFHFITVPDLQSAELDGVQSAVTYGWGMIPVTARIGTTTWKTSLWPKDGGYIMPVKTAVRRSEGLEVGDQAHVQLDVNLS